MCGRRRLSLVLASTSPTAFPGVHCARRQRSTELCLCVPRVGRVLSFLGRSRREFLNVDDLRSHDVTHSFLEYTSGRRVPRQAGGASASLARRVGGLGYGGSRFARCVPVYCPRDAWVTGKRRSTGTAAASIAQQIGYFFRRDAFGYGSGICRL